MESATRSPTAASQGPSGIRRLTWNPRLRTVFIGVSIVMLLMPAGGVVLLRLYESALIRRTEQALIAQGGVVAAAFREAIRRELEQTGYQEPSGYGVAALHIPSESEWQDERRDPRVAALNLALDPVLPAPRKSEPAPRAPDPVAGAVGERLTPVLREARRITLAGVRVVDYHGTVVASSGRDLGRSLSHREEVLRALEGEYVSLLRERISDEPPPPLDSLSRTTKLRVYVAQPVLEGERVWGAVVLQRTPMSVLQSMYGIRYYIAAGVAVLLLLVLLLSAVTSYKVTRPVHRLIRQTERVVEGEKGAAVPLERPGTHEVDQLSRAVARMASTLEQRADYIRAFASSLSHEFKTPLAAIRGTVELLGEHLSDMTPAERGRFLGNLDADAQRLERLVGRLLELARADVIRPAGERTPVSPLLDRLTQRYRGEGLAITVQHGDGVGDVRMAPETLESVLVNLIDNARRHGGDAVAVRLVSRRTRERVVVEVADDGPGISEANAARVFDPFFTTARDAGGTGLGLSIVRSLLTAHGGAVTLQSRPGETVFTMSLRA